MHPHRRRGQTIAEKRGAKRKGEQKKELRCGGLNPGPRGLTVERKVKTRYPKPLDDIGYLNERPLDPRYRVPTVREEGTRLYKRRNGRDAEACTCLCLSEGGWVFARHIIPSFLLLSPLLRPGRSHTNLTMRSFELSMDPWTAAAITGRGRLVTQTHSSSGSPSFDSHFFRLPSCPFPTVFRLVP